MKTYVIEHWLASYFGSPFRRLGLQFKVPPWHPSCYQQTFANVVRKAVPDRLSYRHSRLGASINPGSSQQDEGL